MSTFDDQVYNLKEALWHERGKRPDDLERERRERIARFYAPEPKKPELPPARAIDIFGSVLAGLGMITGVVILGLWLLS